MNSTTKSSKLKILQDFVKELSECKENEVDDFILFNGERLLSDLKPPHTKIHYLIRDGESEYEYYHEVPRAHLTDEETIREIVCLWHDGKRDIAKAIKEYKEDGFFWLSDGVRGIGKIY